MASLTRRSTRSVARPMRFLKARKGTLLFISLFIFGVTFGSIYAAQSTNTTLLHSVILNGLSVQKTQSLKLLFFKSAAQTLGLLIYLYFCSNCSKGKPLIFCVPFFFGLSTGAVVTVIMAQGAWSAMPYLMICILIPKFILAIILISACNNAVKISNQLFQNGDGRQSIIGSCVHMGLYAGAFLLFSAAQAAILLLFGHLLPF